MIRNSIIKIALTLALIVSANASWTSGPEQHVCLDHIGSVGKPFASVCIVHGRPSNPADPFTIYLQRSPELTEILVSLEQLPMRTDRCLNDLLAYKLRDTDLFVCGDRLMDIVDQIEATTGNPDIGRLQRRLRS